MNFVEELTWRGMVQYNDAGTEELLTKEQVTAYLVLTLRLILCISATCVV